MEDQPSPPASKKDTRFPVKEPAELMKFLIDQLPHKNRDNIKSLLRNRQVFVEGEAVSQFNHPLEVGQTVEVRWERIPEERSYRGITIVYEDASLIVVDKHAGILSVATDNSPDTFTAYSMLSTHVKLQHPANKIFVVHRLDRDTSGLMMFAKREDVKFRLQDDWANAVTERTYAAVVEGVITEPYGRIRSYLYEGKNLKMYSSQDPKEGALAITHFEVLRTSKENTLLKINLETGRKNQIRAHMEEIGHPIVGDTKYGALGDPIGRLGLHAWVLAFYHPVTGREMHFNTNIPRKFLRLF